MDNDEAVVRKMVFKRKEAITGPSPMMGGIEWTKAVAEGEKE